MADPLTLTALALALAGGEGGGGADSRLTIAAKTTNQGIADSTVLANATDLVLPLEAGARYLMLASLLLSGDAAADIKLGWTYPVGMTMLWGNALSLDKAESAGSGLVSTTTTVLGVFYFANINNPTNAGDLQLQFAQQVSNGTPSVINAGSTLILFKTA